MTTVLKALRGLLFAVAALAWVGAASSAELGTRTSSAGGVTVDVTAKRVAAGAPVWEFAVVLTTHSGNLGDDLVKSSVLVDAQGGRYSPIAWEGSPPGGHHRSGVLRFKGLVPVPDAVELQISRPGEPAPRSFRWNLK